ncbi:glucarate dehydratase [Catenulispora sp. GAS73]|uniref:glucarate dehydratase family protein n=1 Tax=Catenulispora sp. GAS73 TaxID=3156269 RepID=UPI003512B321
MTDLKIVSVAITPVALKDPPLLNSSGVHEPFALRSIVEVHTDAGIVGISEAYGDDATLALLHRAATAVVGTDVFDLNELGRRVAEAVGGSEASSPTELIGAASHDKTVAQAFAAFEVACFDAQGKATGRRVVDLLGGAVRERVDYSAYLFYKWAEHPGARGGAAYWQSDVDPWGEALDPDGIVKQARRMVDRYGFGSLKLKGGVFPPEEEIEAVKALRQAFPGRPVRIDPNANWTVETSHRVAAALEGELEYLEDPTPGIPGMAEVAAKTSLPLATNMCVTSFAEIPESVRLGAVQVILSDHHFWGGFRATQNLAALCRTFDLGLSMHSNTHLGLSLAAMTHIAAATPNLTYALDTHTPWKSEAEDVLVGGGLTFTDGAVTVPSGPGLGVELDRDAVARLHEQYLTCGIRRRDDVGWMQRVRPEWTGKRPRF